MRLKEEILKELEEEKISFEQLEDDINELESDKYDAEEKIRELEQEIEDLEIPQTKLSDALHENTGVKK